MLIAIAYSPVDYDQAVRWADWVNSLGSQEKHEILIVRDPRCKIIPQLGIKFGKRHEIVAGSIVDGWPAGANMMFREAGKHVEWVLKSPYFLWVEADAIPLKSTWIDHIEIEYLNADKRFMGDHVQVENVPPHMSGVGVYASPLSKYAGVCYLAQASGAAWDVAAAGQILGSFHHTNLIEHAWKHPSFTNIDELTAQIAPETELFHASKDGSLIKL